MSWIKSTGIVGLVTVVLLCLIEILFRITHEKDEIVNDQELMKTIYGETTEQAYEVFKAQAVGQMYTPFVEYIERPRSHAVMTVMSSGNRCHYRPIERCTIRGGQDEIWVIGGSTTFGYSVADFETIPAYLSELYTDKVIHNLGAASYFSTIENYRILELLKLHEPPSAIVFIDGLNDMVNFLEPDKSMFSDGIMRRLEGSYFRNSLLFAARGIIENSDLLKFVLVKGNNYREFKVSDEQREYALERFWFNIKVREALAKAFEINILTVLQPTPQNGDYEKSFIPERFRRAEGLIKESNELYQKLKKRKIPFIDLSNIHFDGPRYVDSVHYTPRFNKEIANVIFEKLNP
ncbi:hypothetical protein N9D84_01990 [Planktomarina temperata]|nr:hypothetical protein [Planktomarina temperata]